MPILLGAIADDFTGATDLSNTLVRSGVSVIQTIGVPQAPIETKAAQAVVVALKSRTAPVGAAVDDSLQALDWLLGFEPRQFFFKYCSTFDSTPDGNIGPVADALLARLDVDFALVCPAFPANSRTVYMGNLFAGGRLLSETPMRDHPLTPMRDPNVVRLMSTQSAHRVGLVTYDTVSRGVEAIRTALEELREEGISYGVVDALQDSHLDDIAAAAASHRLVTGGSAIARGLAANFRASGRLGPAESTPLPGASGPAAVLAGSCSDATRAQVAWWQKSGLPFRKLDVARAVRGEPVAEELIAWALVSGDQSTLIFSSDDPDEVRSIQETCGRENASAAIESAMAKIASGLVDSGLRKLIVAGGETSGAVVSALGITGLSIGPEIEIGVPWTETLSDPSIALALKSGNFGSEDFFTRALAMLR